MPTLKDATDILQHISYATIATVNKDGSPRNTAVYCAYDDKQNIYWSSCPDSVHSQNIARTGRVFIVIYNSKSEEGDGVGLYMDATANQLGNHADIASGLELLGTRRGRPFKDVGKFTGGGPQRIYKATPLKMWMNDADQDDDGDFIRDFRVEIQIPRTSPSPS